MSPHSVNNYSPSNVYDVTNIYADIEDGCVEMVYILPYLILPRGVLVKIYM